MACIGIRPLASLAALETIAFHDVMHIFGFVLLIVSKQDTAGQRRRQGVLSLVRSVHLNLLHSLNEKLLRKICSVRGARGELVEVGSVVI